MALGENANFWSFGESRSAHLILNFEGYGLVSLRLIGSVMFRATFNLVTRVNRSFWNTER